MEGNKKSNLKKIIVVMLLIFFLFALYISVGIEKNLAVCNKCGILYTQIKYELFWWADDPIMLNERIKPHNNAYSDFLGACINNSHSPVHVGGGISGLFGEKRMRSIGRGLNTWPLPSKDRKQLLEFLNSEQKKSKEFKDNLRSYMEDRHSEKSKTFAKKMHDDYEKFTINKTDK